MKVRERAYLCLKEILLEGGYSSASLKKWAHVEGGVSLKDRKLLWELVLGVLRWLRRIDYGLSRQIKRYKRLPEEVKILLRLGYYQIVVLDRIPPYSAVNETVELAKAYLPAKYHKFTNAVLRKAARLPYPVVKGDGSVDELASVAYSFPEWMVARYRKWWGVEETVSLLRSQLKPAPYTVWVNIHHADFREVRKELRAEGIECRPLRGAEGEMLEILSTVDIVDHPLYKEGILVPQDLASRLVVKILDPKPGERVLDACAAPGIKSAQIALSMGNEGLVVACEIDPERYRLLTENCMRLGAAVVEARLGDVNKLAGDFEDGFFDRILVDAPCSDLGTVRRRPEIKWKRSPEDVRAFSEKQLSIVDSVLPKLRPGGELVYSVCSLEREETLEVFEKIVALGLEPVNFSDLMPDPLKDAFCERGFAYLFPHKYNTDGFFVAKFRRV